MGSKSLTNVFNFKREISNYDLRNISAAVCLQQPRTDSMKMSFMCERGVYMELIACEN